MSGRKPAAGRPPGGAGRPRTGARVASVQALFQSEQAGENPETVIEQFVRHRIGPNEAEAVSYTHLTLPTNREV